MPAAIQLGNLLIDPDAYVVTISGFPVPLTYREFRLLCLLASGADRVWSRRELVTALGVATSGHGTLSVLISRLRKKLAGSHPYIITTITRRGYALTDRERRAGASLSQRSEPNARV